MLRSLPLWEGELWTGQASGMGAAGRATSLEWSLLLTAACAANARKLPKISQGKRAINSWAAMLSNISLKNVMENVCFGVKGPSEGAS